MTLNVLQNRYNFLDEVYALSGETDITNLYHNNYLIGIVTSAMKESYRALRASITGLSISRVYVIWEQNGVYCRFCCLLVM